MTLIPQPEYTVDSLQVPLWWLDWCVLHTEGTSSSLSRTSTLPFLVHGSMVSAGCRWPFVMRWWQCVRNWNGRGSWIIYGSSYRRRSVCCATVSNLTFRHAAWYWVLFFLLLVCIFLFLAFNQQLGLLIRVYTRGAYSVLLRVQSTSTHYYLIIMLCS